MDEEQGKKPSAEAGALLPDVIVTRLVLTHFLPHQGQKEESLPDRAPWVHSLPTLPLL